MGAYLGNSRNLMIYNMLIIKAKSWGLILNIIILIFLIYSVVILQEIYRIMQVISQSNTFIFIGTVT